MTYRQPTADLPLTRVNTNRGVFSANLPPTYRQPTANRSSPFLPEGACARVTRMRTREGLERACDLALMGDEEFEAKRATLLIKEPEETTT